MKYTIYIFTYGKFDLSCGAAKSIKKFCEHETEIVLVDASKTIKNGPFDKIYHDYFPRWMGWGLIRHNHNGGPGLCIDDDMRLISSASLKDRYNKGNYTIPNGNMIIIWNDIKTLLKIPFNELKQRRMTKHYQCDNMDRKLFFLATRTQAEHIDDIWIHIDKGSEKTTEPRQKLINYIDNNYYCDGVSVASQSVNS